MLSGGVFDALEHPFHYLRYTVFVLQLPAYLPVYLAPERYERASAEFSITLYLVNLPKIPLHERPWR